MGFDGRLLKVEVLDVELASGLMSVREVVRHPGAVVVLAECPDGRFVLVRQYRKAIESELIEVVAGTRDPGETPDECARRELKEETGYSVDALTPLGTIVSAPGYTDERLYVYHALVGERAESAPDEDEQIECVYMNRDEVEAVIAGEGVLDAKTLAAWMLWQRRETQT